MRIATDPHNFEHCVGYTVEEDTSHAASKPNSSFDRCAHVSRLDPHVGFGACGLLYCNHAPKAPRAIEEECCI